MSAGTLDAAFTMAVANGLSEVCRSTADVEDLLNPAFREVRYLVGYSPRLYPFSRRPVLSLRHPYLSMVVTGHHTDGSVPTDRLAAVDTSPRGQPMPLLLAEASKWAAVGSLYDKILSHVESSNVVVEKGGVGALTAPLLLACRSRIEDHPSIGNAIGRYWRMLRGGPNELRQRPLSTKDVDGWFAGETVPASAYLYMCLRMADVVYGEPAALFDLVEFMVGDLVVDALEVYESGASTPTAGEEDPVDDVDVADGENATFGRSEFCPSDDEPGTNSIAVDIDEEEGSDGEEGGDGDDPYGAYLTMSTTALSQLPSLTFPQFKRGLLELVDNWTTTIHPHEWAATLMQWYTKVFTPQDAKLLQYQAKGRGRGQGGSGSGLMASRSTTTSAAAASGGGGGSLGQFSSGVAPGGLAATTKVPLTDAEARDRRRQETVEQRRESQKLKDQEVEVARRLEDLDTLNGSIADELRDAEATRWRPSGGSRLEGWEEEGQFKQEVGSHGVDDDGEGRSSERVVVGVQSQVAIPPAPPKVSRPDTGTTGDIRHHRQAELEKDAQGVSEKSSSRRRASRNQRPKGSLSSSGVSSPVFITPSSLTPSPSSREPFTTPAGGAADALGQQRSDGGGSHTMVDSMVMRALQSVRRPLFYTLLGSHYSGDRFSSTWGDESASPSGSDYEMRCLSTRLFQMASIPQQPPSARPYPTSL